MMADGLSETFFVRRRKNTALCMAMVLLLVAAFIAALSLGAVYISVSDCLQSIGHALFPSAVPETDVRWYGNVVVKGRIPRALMCILTGATLGAAGVMMQGVLRNPLVSPFTLGVSSAASFGASLSIVYGAAVLGSAATASFVIFGTTITALNGLTVLLAAVFGIVSIVLVLLIGRSKHVSRSTLILSGVVVGYLFQAGVTLLKYISDDSALREITIWLMGGMWNSTWGAVLIVLPVVAVAIAFLWRQSLDVNALMAGDEVASNLGINVAKLRRNALIATTVSTSACIAFTGVIGFVGLMAPHICKTVIGNDDRYVLPVSMLLGALILLVSDIVARIIIAPSEMPVGVIMYIIGGAFFIWLVVSRDTEAE